MGSKVYFKIILTLFLVSSSPAFSSENSDVIKGLYVAPINGAGSWRMANLYKKGKRHSGRLKKIFFDDNGTVEKAPIRNANGIVLMTDWNTIESEKDQFNFSYFDQSLSTLLKYNRENESVLERPVKAIIGILPVTKGSHDGWEGEPSLPKWFWNEKNPKTGKGPKFIRSLTSDWNMINGCLPMKVVAPWDPIYLKRWQKLIRKFGKWKRELSAEKQDLIAGVQVVALPYFHMANMLPKENPSELSDKGKFCTNHPTGVRRKKPDDIKSWLAIGYSLQKIKNSFRSILETFRNELPDGPYAVNLVRSSLPPINERGEVVKNALFANELFNIGSDVFMGKFNPQSTNLATFKSDDLFLEYSAQSPSFSHATGHFPTWQVSIDKDCRATGMGNSYTQNYQTPAVMLRLKGKRKKGEPFECQSKTNYNSLFQQAQLSGATHMLMEDVDFTEPNFFDVTAKANEFFNSDKSGTKIFGWFEKSFLSSFWRQRGIQFEVENLDMALGVNEVYRVVDKGDRETPRLIARVKNLEPSSLYAFSVFVKSSDTKIRLEAISNGLNPQLKVGALFDPARAQVLKGFGQITKTHPDEKEKWRRVTIIFRSSERPASNPTRIRISLVRETNWLDQVFSGKRAEAVFWSPELVPIQE